MINIMNKLDFYMVNTISEYLKNNDNVFEMLTVLRHRTKRKGPLLEAFGGGRFGGLWGGCR